LGREEEKRKKSVRGFYGAHNEKSAKKNRAPLKKSLTRWGKKRKRTRGGNKKTHYHARGNGSKKNPKGDDVLQKQAFNRRGGAPRGLGAGAMKAKEALSRRKDARSFRQRQNNDLEKPGKRRAKRRRA